VYLRINGHTDDRPISTLEFPSNWELSSARAGRVARHLIEKGVHPARIEVHGFAYHRPRANNGSRVGRRANRRVEISLLRSGGEGAQRTETSIH
jgi:chemotaxis protein MotB